MFLRLAVVLCLALSQIQPATAAQLVIGLATETTSLDPHFQDLSANQQVRRHIFESLVDFGPQREVVPGLAESWRVTDDPLVWEFKLRRNVRFHDGDAFTASDAVFSLKRAPVVPGAPSTMVRYLQDIEEVTAPDDHTLRIRTKQPVPTMPINLAPIGMVSAKLVAGKDTSVFNDGSITIGTGPYRFVEFTRGSHLKLAANKDYWGKAPAWETVTLRPLTNAGSRLAALLAGDVDLIDAVPVTDVPRLRREGKITVWEAESNRVLMWSMDVGREKTPWITAKDGSEIANPLRDRRVREAFSLAIDRAALVERIMEGIGIPTNQIVPAGISGHSPDLTVPNVDLARARVLMAEAGHAEGFKITLHTTNNFHANDLRLAQAVAQMLARLNLQVEVVGLPVAVYYGQARERKFTMPQIAWVHTTGDGYVILREALRTGALNNYGNYSNPAVDGLLDGANREMEAKRRSEMLAQAMRLAAADMAVISTHFHVNLWASRKGIRYVPSTDSMTLAMLATPE